MADLSVQDVNIFGATPAYAAASAAGDRFQPRTTGAVLLHVKNGGASAQTVTMDDPTSRSPVGATAFDPDVSISIPAGGERMIAVTNRFVDNNGWVNLAWSGVTTVTLGVFRTV